MSDYLKYKLIEMGIIFVLGVIYSWVSSVRRGREAARRRREGLDY